MKKILVLLFGFMIFGILLSTIGCAIGEEKDDSIEVWRLTQETWLCDAESVADGDCTSEDLGEYITELIEPYSDDLDDDGTIESISLDGYLEFKNGYVREYIGFDINDGGTDTTTIAFIYGYYFGLVEGIYYCPDYDLPYVINGNTISVTADGSIETDGYSRNGDTIIISNLEDPNESATFTKTTITSPTEDCETFSDEKISSKLKSDGSIKKSALANKMIRSRLNRLLKKKPQ